MAWPTVYLSPTSLFERGLRRYSEERCPTADGGHRQLGVFGYHNAYVYIDNVDLPDPMEGYGDTPSVSDRSDPRWPVKCDYCDYVFKEPDTWQNWRSRLYTASDGRMFPINNHDAPDPTPPVSPSESERSPHAGRLPIGAMYTAPWYDMLGKNNRDQPGWPLVVITPGHHPWLVDGDSSNGNGWTRTGQLECLTCSPSILTPSYHGHLQNGQLTDDTERRQYPP